MPLVLALCLLVLVLGAYSAKIPQTAENETAYAQEQTPETDADASADDPEEA